MRLSLGDFSTLPFLEVASGAMGLQTPGHVFPRQTGMDMTLKNLSSSGF